MAGALSTFRYLRKYNATDYLQTQLDGVTADTSTFNSEYIKTGFYDYVGLLVKTASAGGTSPTLNIKAQISHDGGTTWHDVYPVDSNYESTSADTTNQAVISEFTGNATKMKVWPCWFHAGSGGFDDGTDTNLDPRMRFVFTIAGSSATFKISAWLVARKFAGR
jgi:hypothetical protein